MTMRPHQVVAFLFARGLRNIPAQYDRMIAQAVYDARRAFEMPAPVSRTSEDGLVPIIRTVRTGMFSSKRFVVGYRPPVAQL